MEKYIRLFSNKLILLIFNIAIISIFSLSSIVTATKPIILTPLSDIAEKIQQGQVEKITIEGNDIRVELKEGSYLHSKTESGISLMESLKDYGVDVNNLKDIEIELKSSGQSIFELFLFPFFLPFVIYIGWFLVFYFLILASFKILKIEGIPRYKITTYIFAMFIFGLFFSPIISAILKDIPNKFLLYFVNILISFSFTILFLKYYFLLSGKKLWQFFLYLILLNLIFSGIITVINLI